MRVMGVRGGGVAFAVDKHKKQNKVIKTCSVLRTRSWRSRSSPSAVRLHLLLLHRLWTPHRRRTRMVTQTFSTQGGAPPLTGGGSRTRAS